jgi:hypothetical protein
LMHEKRLFSEPVQIAHEQNVKTQQARGTYVTNSFVIFIGIISVYFSRIMAHHNTLFVLTTFAYEVCCSCEDSQYFKTREQIHILVWTLGILILNEENLLNFIEPLKSYNYGL